MCFLIALFLAAFGVAEIYLIWLVGVEAGAFNTALLLILSAVVGVNFARRQGIDSMRRMQASMSQGAAPAESMLDSLAVMAGGALLAAPGFLSDAIGLTMIFPPTRVIWKRLLVVWLKSKLTVVNIKGRNDPPDSDSRIIDV